MVEEMVAVRESLGELKIKVVRLGGVTGQYATVSYSIVIRSNLRSLKVLSCLYANQYRSISTSSGQCSLISNIRFGRNIDVPAASFGI